MIKTLEMSCFFIFQTWIMLIILTCSFSQKIQYLASVKSWPTQAQFGFAFHALQNGRFVIVGGGFSSSTSGCTYFGTSYSSGAIYSSCNNNQNNGFTGVLNPGADSSGNIQIWLLNSLYDGSSWTLLTPTVITGNSSITSTSVIPRLFPQTWLVETTGNNATSAIYLWGGFCGSGFPYESCEGLSSKTLSTQCKNYLNKCNPNALWKLDLSTPSSYTWSLVIPDGLGPSNRAGAFTTTTQTSSWTRLMLAFGSTANNTGWGSTDDLVWYADLNSHPPKWVSVSVGDYTTYFGINDNYRSSAPYLPLRVLNTFGAANTYEGGSVGASALMTDTAMVMQYIGEGWMGDYQVNPNQIRTNCMGSDSSNGLSCPTSTFLLDCNGGKSISGTYYSGSNGVNVSLCTYPRNYEIPMQLNMSKSQISSKTPRFPIFADVKAMSRSAGSVLGPCTQILSGTSSARLICLDRGAILLSSPDYSSNVYYDKSNEFSQTNNANGGAVCPLLFSYDPNTAKWDYVTVWGLTMTSRNGNDNSCNSGIVLPGTTTCSSSDTTSSGYIYGMTASTSGDKLYLFADFLNGANAAVINLQDKSDNDRFTLSVLLPGIILAVFSLIAIALNWMLYYRHMNLGAKTVFNIYVFNFFRIFSLMASILYGLTFWQNMGERNQYRNQGGGPTETYGAICSARVTMNMTIDLVAQIFFFFSVAPELFKGAAIFVSLFISLPRKASFHKFLIDSPFMLLLMLLNAEHRALTVANLLKSNMILPILIMLTTSVLPNLAFLFFTVSIIGQPMNQIAVWNLTGSIIMLVLILYRLYQTIRIYPKIDRASLLKDVILNGRLLRENEIYHPVKGVTNTITLLRSTVDEDQPLITSATNPLASTTPASPPDYYSLQRESNAKYLSTGKRNTLLKKSALDSNDRRISLAQSLDTYLTSISNTNAKLLALTSAEIKLNSGWTPIIMKTAIYDTLGPESKAGLFYDFITGEYATHISGIYNVIIRGNWRTLSGNSTSEIKIGLSLNGAEIRCISSFMEGQIQYRHMISLEAGDIVKVMVETTEASLIGSTDGKNQGFVMTFCLPD